VKIDTKLQWGSGTPSLTELTRRGCEAEDGGYHGLWSAESAHDPFLPLVAAAQNTMSLQLGTAIAVAFARSPMTLAYTAYDLQQLSAGRFMLGLGSQVRPHIERRFAMPWGQPAARMREFIEAMRAIWSAWATSERLDFQGEFYRHTLMTPFFSPPPSPWGPPAVFLAAVGEQMTKVAGAVCDGLLPHPFTTVDYLQQRTLPALQRGLAEAGRALEDFSISLSGLVACGRSAEQMDNAVRRAREQIAFYGSTPAYHAVLELHGWGDLGTELNALSRSESPQRWTRMGELIDDEVLHAFAIVAEPDDLGPAIEQRFGAIVDRFSFYAPYEHDEDLWSSAVEHLSNTTVRQLTESEGSRR
jgi:probable F420-dependent oxidoreductase